jgi:hypothetical protein
VSATDPKLVACPALAALSENFLAAYLVGSFALGAGNAHSDVDFLIVTHREPEIELLRELHRTLPGLPSHWAQHVEGSYVSLAGLHGTGVWLYVDNGSHDVVESNHDNTAVFRWVLRHFGIALHGPPADTIVDEVPAAQLNAEALRSGTGLVVALRQHPQIVDDGWAQTHVVTTVCRIAYTAETGEVTSKLAALDWAASRHPNWVDIIDRARADRPDPWSRVGLPADPALAIRTRQFVAAIPALLGE